MLEMLLMSNNLRTYLLTLAP